MINPLRILGALVDLALPMQASAVQRAAMAHGAFGAREKLWGCDRCDGPLMSEADLREGLCPNCFDYYQDDDTAEAARERLVEREAEEEVSEGVAHRTVCGICWGPTGGCDCVDRLFGTPHSSPAAEAGAVACPPGSTQEPPPVSPGGTTNPSHPPTTTAHRGACGEGPSGLTHSPESPAGSNFTDWAVPAICEVLAEHHPVWRRFDTRYECTDLTTNATSVCSYHADERDWRNHVAPLIAKRLESDGAQRIATPEK